MTRVDLLSKTNKSYFIYSKNVEEICNLAALSNLSILSFTLKDDFYVGFFCNLTLSMIMKMTNEIQCVPSAGVNSHYKKINLSLLNESITLEPLFVHEVKKIKEKTYEFDKIQIDMTFNKEYQKKEAAMLVKTDDLIEDAMNLSFYCRNSIVHCPVTINDTAYSFIKIYDFLHETRHHAVILRKEGNCYIDIRYKINQKFKFKIDNASYIILPETNQIIRFSESPRFFREMLLINKIKNNIFSGIQSCDLFNSDVDLFLEEKEASVKTDTPIISNSVSQPRAENVKEAKEKPIKKKEKIKKDKISIQSIELNKEVSPAIVLNFSKGGITSRKKIEELIAHASQTKNYELFSFAVCRYSFFHPSLAIRNEEAIAEIYRTNFGINVSRSSLYESLFMYKNNIFFGFIKRARNILVNGDILKFTKEKESLAERRANGDRVKEDQYPKEIISGLYSNGAESKNDDNQITETVDFVLSNTKRLSPIASMVKYYADYARYINGFNTVEPPIDITSTIYCNPATNNQNISVEIGQAIVILLEIAKTTGYKFSYNQVYDLINHLEKKCKYVIKDDRVKVLYENTREYYSNECTHWFKTDNTSNPERIISDPTFINSLNLIEKFSAKEFILKAVSKINSENFLFKKSLYIELITDKLLSMNPSEAAVSFVDFCLESVIGNEKAEKTPQIALACSASAIVLSNVNGLSNDTILNLPNVFINSFFNFISSNPEKARANFISFLNKIQRYMDEESKLNCFNTFINLLMIKLSSSNNLRESKIYVACIAEVISSYLYSDKNDLALVKISEVSNNINNGQKALLLNRISKRSFAASNAFKKEFIKICIATTQLIEKAKPSSKEEVIAYYSLLESIFGVYIKDVKEEESRRDLFLSREEDAFYKRINEIESNVNSDEFTNANHNEKTIKEIL